jgi:glutathione S-transferase
MLTLTSHSLCPILHTWVMALAQGGNAPDREYRVVRLAYPDIERWPRFIPAGAELPYLQTDEGELLMGGLPILQFFEETKVTTQLLATEPFERARIRRRALLAFDVFQALRPVFVAKSEAEVARAATILADKLKACALQPWSSEPRLDRLAWAAVATLVDQPKIARLALWAELGPTKSELERLARQDWVIAARAPNYESEFRAFYAAFG